MQSVDNPAMEFATSRGENECWPSASGFLDSQQEVHSAEKSRRMMAPELRVCEQRKEPVAPQALQYGNPNCVTPSVHLLG
jgi:hypothetical protein